MADQSADKRFIALQSSVRPDRGRIVGCLTQFPKVVRRSEVLDHVAIPNEAYLCCASSYCVINGIYKHIVHMVLQLSK